MTKAIIFGAFSYIGYQLCCQMINKEIHVIAVDELPKENSLEEEYMLQIGRNAYFEFIEYATYLNNRDSKPFQDVETAIYAWNGDVYRTAQLDFKIKDLIDYCKKTKSKLILASSQKVTKKEEKCISSFGKADEIDIQWYSKVDFSNSFNEHKKIAHLNNEYIFTFIDFARSTVEEGITKSYEHIEWVTQRKKS